MTAQPKHWPSSRRQGRRRATHSVKLTAAINCKVCGSPKSRGYVCKNCNQ